MNEDWLVKEIREKFRENDYPGCSLASRQAYEKDSRTLFKRKERLL